MPSRPDTGGDRCLADVARGSQALIRRILRRDLHYRLGPWLPRDCREPIYGWCVHLSCFHVIHSKLMNGSVTGPPKYAELRINLAQAVQAIGTVVGPVLGISSLRLPREKRINWQCRILRVLQGDRRLCKLTENGAMGVFGHFDLRLPPRCTSTLACSRF
jgi:hypothetical protein